MPLTPSFSFSFFLALSFEDEKDVFEEVKVGSLLGTHELKLFPTDFMAAGEDEEDLEAADEVTNGDDVADDNGLCDIPEDEEQVGDPPSVSPPRENLLFDLGLESLPAADVSESLTFGWWTGLAVQ